MASKYPTYMTLQVNDDQAALLATVLDFYISNHNIRNSDDRETLCNLHETFDSFAAASDLDSIDASNIDEYDPNIYSRHVNTLWDTNYTDEEALNSLVFNNGALGPFDNAPTFDVRAAISPITNFEITEVKDNVVFVNVVKR